MLSRCPFCVLSGCCRSAIVLTVDTDSSESLELFSVTECSGFYCMSLAFRLLKAYFCEMTIAATIPAAAAEKTAKSFFFL